MQVSHGELGDRGERAEPRSPLVGAGLSGKGYPWRRAGASGHGVGTGRGSWLKRDGNSLDSGLSPVGVAWWVGFIQWAELPDESRLLGLACSQALLQGDAFGI